MPLPSWKNALRKVASLTMFCQTSLWCPLLLYPLVSTARKLLHHTLHTYNLVITTVYTCTFHGTLRLYLQNVESLYLKICVKLFTCKPWRELCFKISLFRCGTIWLWILKCLFCYFGFNSQVMSGTFCVWSWTLAWKYYTPQESTSPT